MKDQQNSSSLTRTTDEPQFSRSLSKRNGISSQRAGCLLNMLPGFFTLFGRDVTLTFDRSFADELARESWTMYGLGISFIILRTYARVRRNGRRGLTPDDYLMWVAAGWYTILVVCLNVIADGGGSNLYPPGQFDNFTDAEIKDRIKGSKIVVLSEQAMLNIIYTLKVCMLFIYTRLTVQLKHQIFVKILAVYVACGYVGTQLAFFFACRPFKGYWAMPPPSSECATLAHYAITQGCFNISSDAFLLAISIPLLVNTSLPLKQKIVLLVIFGMGLFVILAAILTKVFNLTDVYSTVYMLWYVRESSVAVWVTNLPLIWPLLRETFPMLRSFTPGLKGYTGSSRNRHKTLNSGGADTSVNNNTTIKSHGGIGVKTSTHISVMDRGFALDTLRNKSRRPGDDSISLDSDERVLTDEANGKTQFDGASGGAVGGMDEESLRDLEAGEGVGTNGLHGWDVGTDDDHGYQVRIHASTTRGNSFTMDNAESITDGGTDGRPLGPQHSGEGGQQWSA